MAGVARSRAAYGGGERARRSESTYAQLVDMMSRIVAHDRLGDGSLKNFPARGEPTLQNSTRGGISIILSIQIGLSRSLGSATSNEANKRRCSAQSGPSPRAQRCSVWPK